MGLPNEIHPITFAGVGKDYKVANSLRFRASNTANMARTPSVAGNRKTWTWSYWIKRGTLSSVQLMLVAYSGASDSGNFDVRFNASDQLLIYGWTSLWRQTTQVFRDPTAWYHILINADTTSATGADRVKLYINGSRVTTFASSTDPTQNSDLAVGSVGIHRISGNSIPDGLYFDGYMAEMYMVDGFAYDPSYFGQIDSITGQWVPKKYSGSYGTNGFYLPFNDATSTTTLGYDRQLSMSDSSKNNWTLNNFTVNSPANTTTYLHDVYIDVPTNWNDGSTNRANYPTLNPLSNLNTTLNSGNLYQYYAGSWSSALATIGVTSGKWYMEAYQVAVVATSYTIIGVAYQPWTTSTYLGGSATSYGFQWGGATSYKYFNNNGGVAVSTPSGTASAGSILQLAFDADTGNVWYGLNNTWAEGSPSAGTGASHTVSPTPGIGSVWFMGIGQYGGNASAVNFGQRPFNYTPPTGFKALNSYNLPNPSLPLV